ncbi:MAG: CYTH domain-containing protein [Acidimicrobiales bacterium]
MGVEIERKFLVEGDGWRTGARASRIRQAYLVRAAGRSVRVRDEDGRITLTIKGPGDDGDPRRRAEFEYELPAADADGLFALCEPGTIDKTRHRVDVAGRTWEVDEFHGRLAPLVVAEIELGDGESPDAEVVLPPWVGREVTDDPSYTNGALSRRA